MKKEKITIVKKPFYTDEFINNVCIALQFGTDPATAAVSLGAQREEWFDVMNKARFDKKDENRKHYDQINTKCAQIEIKLVDKWANAKEGGAQAADFLKATKKKFNRRMSMAIEAELTAVCQIILNHSCQECKSTLVGMITALNSTHDALDVEEALNLNE